MRKFLIFIFDSFQTKFFMQRLYCMFTIYISNNKCQVEFRRTLNNHYYIYIFFCNRSKDLSSNSFDSRIPEPTTATIDTSSKTFKCLITLPSSFNSKDAIAFPKSSLSNTIEILDSEGP